MTMSCRSPMHQLPRADKNVKCELLKTVEEPWLVDKATLQYPEHIPTLVLDVDKVFYWIDWIGSIISACVHCRQVILKLEHDSKKARDGPRWICRTLMELCHVVPGSLRV